MPFDFISVSLVSSESIQAISIGAYKREKYPQVIDDSNSPPTIANVIKLSGSGFR
jgi:hypothetical protein